MALKTSRRLRLLFVAAVFLIVAAMIIYPLQNHIAPQGTGKRVRVELGDGYIDADVADTEALREQGLSGRRPLIDTRGMLFVFDAPAYYAFWMKDMLFPIDMIWLDANKKVVYIQADATPDSYPASFTPSAPSLYVIEVPAQWAWLHRVQLGSVATFDLSSAK